MTRLFCATLLLVSWQAVPQPLAVTNTFSNSTVADAEEINQNFADIIDGVNGKLTTDNDDPYTTAVGFNTLSNITTGFGNTAIGYESLASNTEGGRNTASGFRALLNNLTGYQNTATGYGALFDNTIGSYNTASGYTALFSNTEGDYNTAVGVFALTNNTIGYQNTAVGFNALDRNTIGYNNTALGNGADVATGILTNATAVGYLATVDASDKVRIGNAFVSVIEGEVAFTSSSDARLKEKISPVTDGLALINDLNPVSYHRINNPAPDIEMGLLAQEVEATLEKHGLGNSGMVHQPTQEAHMSLRYNDLMAPMIKAIQELDVQHQREVASLQEQLASQKGELLAIVRSQQEQIAQLQRMVEHQFAKR